ncbi:MAG: SulP family inorganic anion transporter [Chloroflexota bacterium]|nr:SulP family inorganic anion transporter [Chloroflexota bacterium]
MAWLVKALRAAGKELRLSQLLPGLAAGFANGIIDVFFNISLAALIFSGDLAIFFASGVGIALFGAMVVGIVAVMLSSFPGTVASLQDVPAAILALMVVAIASRMPAGATSQEIFLTIATAIALTTLLTALFFLALGTFKLGRLIRFVPYPVMGGFLAGTGWLLLTGAIGVMADITPSLSQLPTLFGPDVLVRWVPAVLLGGGLLLILNRYSHFLVLPAALVGIVLLFYIAVWVTHTPLAELRTQGWLVGPFPESGLWQPFLASDLSQVRWSLIVGQVGGMTAILLTSAIGLLLSVSGLELVVKRDIDVDRELVACGFGNLASALSGGMVGYTTISLSALGHKLGSHSRLVGLLTAASSGIALFFGTAVLGYFPKVLIGSLLALLGLSLLIEWLYESWFKLSKADYLIILLILVVIASVGFLEGVAVGLVAALLLFAINYSRIDVVKHELSGASYRSTVTRSKRYRDILHQQGAQLYILQLQGFLFFGTANTLLTGVRRRIERVDRPRVRFFVLDFRFVTGFDTSALLSFQKMQQLAQAYDITLVFTVPFPDIRRQLEQGGICEEQAENVRMFSDLDHAVEWCENQILLAAGAALDDERPSFEEQLQELFPVEVDLARFKKYLGSCEVPAGHYLIRQGDEPDDLYFIERGQVTAQLEMPGDKPVRLQSMHGGTVVGEIGMYLGVPRTASVITDRPCTVHRLSSAALREMEENDPDLASALHRSMIQILAERLVHNIHTVEALQQ